MIIFTKTKGPFLTGYCICLYFFKLPYKSKQIIINHNSGPLLERRANNAKVDLHGPKVFLFVCYIMTSSKKVIHVYFYDLSLMRCYYIHTYILKENPRKSDKECMLQTLIAAGCLGESNFLFWQNSTYRIAAAHHMRTCK